MAQPPAPRLISVHAAVQEYVDGLERKTRKSPHTITAYSRDLNEFVRLLNDVGITADASLDDVEADHVDAVFVAYETQRDQRARTAPAPRHSAATVKRFRAAVSAFFRNADELNLVQISPMVHSQFQPRDSPDAGLAPWRKAMDADAAQRLLDVTLTGIPTQRPPGANVPDLRLRDHLMVRLMMEAGPRVSELVAFNLADLTTRTIGGRTERFLQIQHGKGRKARSAPLSPATWAIYQTYIDSPREVLVSALAADAPKHTRRDSNQALLLSVRGRRMTPRGVELRLDRLSAAVGARVTPHGLRHTAATQLLEGEGVTLPTVRNILGHADISTTSRYLDADATAAAEAVRNHPITGAADG